MVTKFGMRWDHVDTRLRLRVRHLGVILVLWCSATAAQDRTLQLAPQQAAPSGERRIALVIGNSAYKDSPLRNPVNDAHAISKALSGTGFKVTVVENASETTMRRAIRAFGDELAKADVGLFYYAGHGMQVRGRNYLIPVNADIQREDEVEDQAVDANLVLSKMDTAKNSLNLMILDACRNNPFARSFRSSSRGLAQMDAPSGTLVAFATAPGSVAADGDGDNGIYTKHLLANIHRPGLPIEQLFKEVRIGVGRETGDRQVPWESSSLRGDFYFVAPIALPADEAQREQLEKAVAEARRQEQEKLLREQRRMQATIREMLAKQRAELEEEMRRREEVLGRKPAAAPGQAAAEQEPEAQTQMASLAPVSVSSEAINPRFPKVGDRWEYLYTDTATGESRTQRVQIVGVSKDGILDEDDFSMYGRGTRVHGPKADLLILNPLWVFSPYLHLFDAAQPGARWSDIAARNDFYCGRLPTCAYSGKVVGRESVETRAGNFDAIKVEIFFSSGSPTNIRHHVQRRATFWYAEEAKRVVKSTVRTYSQNGSGPNYDWELVSYNLN